MPEPDEQATSTGEPEEAKGSVLQQYLSRLGMPAGNAAQLGMPTGTVLGQINDSRPGYLSNDLRLPRYYGAPPDLTSNASTSRSTFGWTNGTGSSQETVGPAEETMSALRRIGLFPQSTPVRAPEKRASKINKTGGKKTQSNDLQSAPSERLSWDPLSADMRKQIEDDRMLTEQSSRDPRSLPSIDPKTLPQASRRGRPVSPSLTEFVKIAVPNANPTYLKSYLSNVIDALRERGVDLNNPEVLRYVFSTINAENDSFKSEDEKPSYGRKGTANTSSRDAELFDNYENNVDSLGNTEPGDGARFKGRGLVQLTGRGKYTDMKDALGIDLVNQPELANDPEIASRILAQSVVDEIAKLHMLKDDPDPRISLNAYKEKLEDPQDNNPEIKATLVDDPMVKARAVVNGGYRGDKPLKNLPNGLSNFLTSEAFGRQYQEILRRQEHDPDLTVGEAAEMFGAADPFGGGAEYLQQLKQLGLDLNAKLSNVTSNQQKLIDQSQRSYVRNVMNKLHELSKKKGAKQVQDAARKANQAAK